MIIKTHSFTLTGLELYERGAKAAIARELGVPATTVYRWIERKSVPPGYELAIREKVAHKKTLGMYDDIRAGLSEAGLMIVGPRTIQTIQEVMSESNSPQS